MPDRSIPAYATVVACGDVLASQLGDEFVLLHPVDGMYYGLDDVGGEIWKLLSEPISVDEICRAVMDMYDVNRERCREDVLRLLGELAARRLIEIREQADRGPCP